MIKGVIFDYDGVIADTFVPVFETHRKMFKLFNKGVFVPLEQFRQMDSTNWKQLYRDFGFTEKEIDQLPPIFLEEMMKLGHECKIFDGMDQTIKALRKKFRLAIVSNGDSRRIRHQLGVGGLLRCFDFIIGLEAERHKPEPHQLVACMAALGLKPEETCYVGDTAVDIEAGRNARLAKVIAVTYGYHPAHFLSEADIVVHSPAELLEVLEGLQ